MLKGRLTENGSIMPWLVTALGLEILDLPYNALAVDDLTEHDVLLI